MGFNNVWHFNVTPTGRRQRFQSNVHTPRGRRPSHVYADGIREQASNVTFVVGSDTFTLAAGRAPSTTIAADYLASALTAISDANSSDLVELTREKAVIRTFKKRDSEGRASEGFQESRSPGTTAYLRLRT